MNCHNNVENEAARREAVEATLERNPNAFRPKIASSPHGSRDIKVCVRGSLHLLLSEIAFAYLAVMLLLVILEELPLTSIEL